ncbi:hypothetical protein [Methyloglobulus sp.]|uniref:hypothetical protein n=1 Tax=Methyloglobulus sp. TaxID=2518622 RepID=UPI0032B82AF8
MQHINKVSDSAHQELSQLLPWYVNKTLQGSELKEVDHHLTVCLTCKREVVQLQKLAHVVIKEGSLDSAEQASFSRLKKRLHTAKPLDMQSLPQQNRPEQLKIGASDNVRRISRARKQGWINNSVLRPALAMAAVVLLSLLMPRYLDTEVKLGNEFRTLSNAQQNPISANEIRVVFAEGISQQQKGKILKRIHGQFIDNPTAQGVYTVRLDRDMTPTDPLGVVGMLRKDSSVIFAEPAYELLSSTHMEKEK